MKNWIFFTGAPGSRWSGISKLLCQHPTVNNSDCNETREYRDMHRGHYFGPGMEFGNFFRKMENIPSATLLAELNAPYADDNQEQLRILKSHAFAYNLDFIKEQFPDSKILMVYRDDYDSLKWWLEAGGFDITYPKYDWYVDESTMLRQIKLENQGIFDFVVKHGLTLEPFDSKWIKTNFGWDMPVDSYFDGVSVAIA